MGGSLARIVGGLVAFVIVLGVIGFGVLWLSPSLQDAVFARVARSQIAKSNAALLDDKSLKVILCGTGSPMPDPHRANACTAVIAGGHMVLIDAGPRSWSKIAQMRLPGGAIEAVFLTHLHSDHFGGLGEVNLQGWVNGRPQPLDVYGPSGPKDLVNAAGTPAVVAGLLEAYRADKEFRVAHHDEAHMPPSAEGMVAHEIPTMTQGEAVTVYDKDGLKISAFLVNHLPIEPAFGYRVEYGGRVAIISGDTIKNENLALMSKDADLLVHEALNKEMVAGLAEQVEASGSERLAKMLRDTLGYHTSPVEAAEIAHGAGVKLLVYSHIVPPLPNGLARHMFLRGVSDVQGDTDVEIGDDGLMITLPEGKKDYQLKSLL